MPPWLFSTLKWFGALTTPLAAGCLVVVGVLVLGWRRPHLGRVLAVLVVVGLGLLGTAPVAERFAAPLERAHCLPAADVVADAAVVLGGAVDVAHSTPERVEFNGRVERILEGARLVTTGRARKLVLVGGSGDPRYPDRSEAVLMQGLARALGVPAEAILLESASRTTRENAERAVPLLERWGIETFFLVTSALHMPRALGCFRKVGADPVPYPVDLRVTPTERAGWTSWIPSAATLALTEEALHEYVGYGVYRVLGYL